MPQPQTTELTLHNLSTYNLTTADYQLLEKGLSFAPTVRLPPTTLQHQILQSFNHFAKSLRLRYMRVTGSSSKPHEHQPKHCTAAHLYRPMKFLPKPKVETPLETLEDNTKQMLADNLPTLCSNHPPNLTALQQNALTKHKSTRQTLTIKPADNNLGIVLMNYISQCLLHLTGPSYPKDNIQRELHNLIIAFKEQLHKRLETYLSDGPQHPRIPQFYGIPKMHNKFQHLPPMRPIVSPNSLTTSYSPSLTSIQIISPTLLRLYFAYGPR